MMSKNSTVAHSKGMMKLGDFTFTLNTAAYQNYSHSSSYNWPEQARIGNSPVLQFTGTGVTSLSLSGVIFPYFRGGLEQVEDMRRLAGSGKPLLLISGTGTMKGYWCITSVKEKSSEFRASGLPRKIEFTMDLKYYGDKL